MAGVLKAVLQSRALRQAAVLVLPLMMVAAPGAASDKLYRYRNADGVLVIDYKVPPEYIAGGYDILSTSGRLIQHIPPQQQQAGKDLSLSDSGEAMAAQREVDQYLVRSYSSVSEIEGARDRKLGMLKREMELIERNLVQTVDALKQEELRAANLQRSGRDVSKSLLQQLKDLEQQHRDAIDMLDVRNEEFRQVEARYQSYINRYRELSQSQGQNQKASQ